MPEITTIDATDVMAPPCAEVVAAVRAGEPNAYNVLVERYYGMIFAVGFARLRSREAAQDLAQEVFLRAYLCLDQLADPAYYPGWITSMARNLAVDWLRRGSLGSRIATMVPLNESHHEIADERGGGTREQMETGQAEKALHEALSKLGQEQREIVLMHFMENLTQEEIAERLGVHRSSISRALERSLKRMRAMLTPELREAMPQLRAPRSAIVRTLILIAAVAKLAGSQRSALAAVAGAGAKSKTASTAGGSGVSWLVAIVKSLLAWFARLGALLKLGIAASVIAALGSTVFYIQNVKGTNQQVMSFEARLFDLSMTQNYIARHPENQGLPKLVAALSATNLDLIFAASKGLNEIIKNGWGLATDKEREALRSNSVALNAAYSAASFAPFDIPPIDDRGINWNKAGWLCRLMLVDARQAEASSDFDQAAQKALAAVQLSESFRDSPGVPATYPYGASYANPARTLAAILSNFSLSSNTAQTILETLQTLDLKRREFADSVWDDFRYKLTDVHDYKYSPAKRQALDRFSFDFHPGTSSTVLSLNSTTDFEHEARRIAEVLAANFKKPFYQRARVDANYLRTVSRDPLVPILDIEFWEQNATRDDVAVAYFRLCEAIAALRSDPTTTTAAIRDPFADRPITVTADRVYSFGPDSIDQKGYVVYDPTNGTISPGDIVAKR